MLAWISSVAAPVGQAAVLQANAALHSQLMGGITAVNTTANPSTVQLDQWGEGWLKEEAEAAQRGRGLRNGDTLGDKKWRTANQQCRVDLADCRDGKKGKKTVEQCHEIYSSCLDAAHEPHKEERIAEETEKEEAKQLKEEIDEAQEGRALRNGDPKNHTPQQACQITLADCRDSGKFTMLQCHTKYRSCLDKADKKAEKMAATSSP